MFFSNSPSDFFLLIQLVQHYNLPAFSVWVVAPKPSPGCLPATWKRTNRNVPRSIWTLKTRSFQFLRRGCLSGETVITGYVCPHLTEFDNWLLHLVILAQELRHSSQTLANSLQTGILIVTNNARKECELSCYCTLTVCLWMLCASNCIRATNQRHYTDTATKARVIINLFNEQFISNSVLKRGA